MPVGRSGFRSWRKCCPTRTSATTCSGSTGLSLLGEVNGDKQIAPIAYGGGANGKTTFIESVCFAMGDYAMTAEPTC